MKTVTKTIIKTGESFKMDIEDHLWDALTSGKFKDPNAKYELVKTEAKKPAPKKDAEEKKTTKK